MKMYRYVFIYISTYKCYVIAEVNITTYFIRNFYNLLGGLAHLDGYSLNTCYYKPNNSMYLFATLRDALNFASKKIDLCPTEGKLYGYKKADLYKNASFEGCKIICGDGTQIPIKGGKNRARVDECLVTLLIPANAKRTGCYYEKKCRAEFAEVVKIERICSDGSLSEVSDSYWAESIFAYYDYASVEYKVGQIVYADSFNNNKDIACSNGIHFFLKKEEALAYEG